MTQANRRLDAAALVLHDSPIESVELGEGKLTFTVELCAWMQPGYANGDPELVSGGLVYEGVGDLRLDPPERDVLRRPWWRTRGGLFLRSDSAPRGSARLVFEAGAPDGSDRRTFLMDFHFATAFFEPARRDVAG